MLIVTFTTVVMRAINEHILKTNLEQVGFV
jgi:hypothetical protein